MPCYLQGMGTSRHVVEKAEHRKKDDIASSRGYDNRSSNIGIHREYRACALIDTIEQYLCDLRSITVSALLEAAAC